MSVGMEREKVESITCIYCYVCVSYSYLHVFIRPWIWSHSSRAIVKAYICITTRNVLVFLNRSKYANLNWLFKYVRLGKKIQLQHECNSVFVLRLIFGFTTHTHTQSYRGAQLINNTQMWVIHLRHAHTQRATPWDSAHVGIRLCSACRDSSGFSVKQRVERRHTQEGEGWHEGEKCSVREWRMTARESQ